MLDINSDKFDLALDKIIHDDIQSREKKAMEVAERYYRGEHDILNYRLFYFDRNGERIEELNRSNIKIPHQFLTELVDQKTNYLLSNPIEFKTEDEELEKHLEEYITDDLQSVIKDAVEGASIKSHESLYFYYTEENMIQFEVADSYHLIFIADEFDVVQQVIRHYTSYVYEQNGDKKELYRVEIYDHEMVHYFIRDEKGKFVRDKVPKYHRAIQIGNQLYSPEENRLPFLVLRNNKRMLSDLEPVKALIDDFDLMAGSLSNNLVDFDYPIYAVKGFQGDDLDDLITNLRTRKAIGVGADGGLDVKTIDIPVEAREAKLNLDRESIYKFGMGFDSTANVSDRAITNLGIQSRYSLLDIKANKFETELKAVLRDMLALILENIEERYNKRFDSQDIEIIITREAMTNDKEIADTEHMQAQTKLTMVNALANAGMVLEQEAIIKKMCEVLEIPYDDVKAAMEENPVPMLVGGDIEVQ